MLIQASSLMKRRQKIKSIESQDLFGIIVEVSKSDFDSLKTNYDFET